MATAVAPRNTDLMAFQVETDEQAADGLRRVLIEQFERAQSAIERASDDTLDEAIHDVRKRCKRVRATLRLVRSDLGPKMYERENGWARDAARQLAPTRDAHVVVETLDRVVGHFADHLARDAFAPVRKVLEERRLAILPSVAALPGEALRVGEDLAAACDRVPGLPISGRWKGIESGMRRTYAAGRALTARATAAPDDLLFHELRKQVKYFWHQIQLVAPVWPATLSALAEEAHRLADDLGDAHDHAMLHAVLVADPDLGGDAVAVEALTGLVDRRRLAFQQRAQVRAQRIYAETPESFVARIGGYWRAARQ